MKFKLPAQRRKALVIATMFVGGWVLASSTRLEAKDKTPPVDPNDPTLRLFQLLDTSRGGKLADFYVIADVYKDPNNPNDELQHILRAEYDKNRGYGKLNIYIRSVGKIAPEQLRAYTPKEFYEFGVVDIEKFMKTDPGPFKDPGDRYLRSLEERPLAGAPITDEVRKNYETFVNDHLIPALSKK